MVVARSLWAVCLVVAAAMVGVGIDLHMAGAEPLVSYPVVVGGVLLAPLASALIERFLLAPAPE